MTATLITGARLLLPEPAPEGCDSVGVLDGTIVHVGSAAAVRAALGSDAQDLDVGGRTVAPGFVDAHTHPMIMCVFEQHLRFHEGEGEVGSVADVLDLVAERAARGEGTVIGFGLDDALLAERRLPTAEELDRAADGGAVVLVRRDGHHAVASTSAIVAAGLADPSAVPEGGVVEFGPDGRPTGLVGERAVESLYGLMPEITMEALSAGAEQWSRRLLRQGITGLTAFCQTSPEGPSGEAGALEAIGWSAVIDALPFDVQTVLIGTPGDVEEYRAVPSLNSPERRRRLDGIKLFLDGTLGGATACMHAPFTDRPDTSGLRTLGDAEAYERMVAAHTAGLQIAIHAIGDAANRAAADLYARLLAEHPGPHRHRVEHASVLDAATIDAFAELGIACVVQPIGIRTEAHWLGDRLGQDRLRRTYPLRSLLDAGVNVAGSSDAPIESTDVLAAMDAAVHRDGIGDAEAITPAEALAAYTTGAATARGAWSGRIEPGQPADLVVLSDDPLTAPLTSITVDATCIGGTFHHSTLGEAAIHAPPDL